MCRTKGCDMRMAGNCICCVVCKCEQTCFECCSSMRCYNHMYKYTYQTPHYEPRHKFVCFPCRRVWKSYVSKYQAMDNTLMSDIYNSCRSNCAKCGNKGILVGKNFRPCKNEKEWKKIEQDIFQDGILTSSGKYKLWKDYHDCPNEGFRERFYRKKGHIHLKN